MEMSRSVNEKRTESIGNFAANGAPAPERGDDEGPAKGESERSFHLLKISKDVPRDG